MADARVEGGWLPDVNVLVALTNRSHVHHRQAHAWLASVDTFATTPVTETGLMRLLLSPAVTGQPVTGAHAVAVVRAIRSQPRASFLPDSSSLADAGVDLAGLAGHQQVADLHLVNLAAASGRVLVTFDSRIPRSLTRRDRRWVHVL